jgi:pilus assembly protein TadC
MENATPSEWKIDYEYKKKLTLEDSKFIFEQAEKSFNDTIETSKKILERSSTLLTLVSGLLVTLVAYSIKKWEANQFDNLLFTAIFTIVYFFILGVFFIFPNIKPKEYTLPGTQPKKYFVDELFNVTPPTAGRILLLYIIEIKNLQQGIEENRLINEKRWTYYKKSLNLIFLSPAIVIIIYIIINYIKK